MPRVWSHCRNCIVSLLRHGIRGVCYTDGAVANRTGRVAGWRHTMARRATNSLGEACDHMSVGMDIQRIMAKREVTHADLMVIGERLRDLIHTDQSADPPGKACASMNINDWETLIWRISDGLRGLRGQL